MFSPILGQGKDVRKNGINDGHREDQESCQNLGRNMVTRYHLSGIGLGLTSIKTEKN